MHAGIHSRVRQGVMTKHRTPRFPGLTETERLLGFAVTFAFGCQEASGSLVGMESAATVLAANGSTQYRKPLTGIPEVGARAVSGAVNGWSKTDAAALVGTGSFLLALYSSWDGVSAAINFGFGFMDEGDGAQFLMINPTAGGATYQARAVDDSLNSKSYTKTPAPSDKSARCHALLYDAGDGNVYHHVSGSPVTATAIGTWAGLGAGVSAAGLRLGQWPGVNGTGITARYALLAKGATLNGKGPQLGAIMRRFGWD